MISLLTYTKCIIWYKSKIGWGDLSYYITHSPIPARLARYRFLICRHATATLPCLQKKEVGRGRTNISVERKCKNNRCEGGGVSSDVLLHKKIRNNTFIERVLLWFHTVYVNIYSFEINALHENKLVKLYFLNWFLEEYILAFDFANTPFPFQFFPLFFFLICLFVHGGHIFTHVITSE